MTSFDDIEIRRPELAQAYLGLLQAQPGRPLALFAPRRVGKTFFLDHDLTPEATKAGLLPVYADLWLHKSAPLHAINHALEEALDIQRVPVGRIAKVAQTPIKKVGALGISLDLGETPSLRPLPTEATLRLDALVGRLSAHHQGQILLMLDEVQTLGDVPDGVAMIAALRAVLHKRRLEVCAVFTGSSQEGLARLMNSAGAPMYQFAQVINFPMLDDAYLQRIAEHFASVHQGKVLDLTQLREAFQDIGYRPALMRDVIKAMSAEGMTDVATGLARFMSSPQQVATWQALLNSVSAFDQGVLMALAHGMAPMGQTTLKALTSIPGPQPTIAKVRASIDKLKRQGMVSKSEAGTSLDDPLFAQFLRSQPLAARLLTAV